MSQALTLIRSFGVSRLAGELGVTHGAVSQWRRIPAERVIEIERITGISREKLRPDLYPSNAPSTQAIAHGNGNAAVAAPVKVAS
jgi:DNA-binding transcriptional regulator YdaS (Cro superfamily)